MTYPPSLPDTAYTSQRLSGVPAGSAESERLNETVSSPVTSVAVLTVQEEIDNVALPRFAKRPEQQRARQMTTRARTLGRAISQRLDALRACDGSTRGSAGLCVLAGGGEYSRITARSGISRTAHRR